MHLLNKWVPNFLQVVISAILGGMLAQCQTTSVSHRSAVMPPKTSEKSAKIQSNLIAKMTGLSFSSQSEDKLIQSLEYTPTHRVITWKDQQAILTFRSDQSVVENGHQCRYYQLSIVNDQEVHVYPEKACQWQKNQWQLSE